MRLPASWAVLVGLLTLTTCTPEVELVTEEQKASYGIGIAMGNQVLPGADRMDMVAYRLGFEDALAGVASRIPPDELARAVEAFSRSVMERTSAIRDSLATKNSAEGEAYLAQNGARDGVTTSSSGLQYEVLEEGAGPSPDETDRVRVHFRGSLINGIQFDSSYDRGEPQEFDMAQLVPGWFEALRMMSVGSKYRVVIPTDLAYGMEGMGRFVEPMATIIYEIELIEILE